MLSVAPASVHRSIRPKAPTSSSNTANMMVDTNLSWNAELTQSPKRRRSHQRPCNARKKLIQSPTKDISLNLNLNNAEITLTPIRKTVSNAKAIGSGVEQQVDLVEKIGDEIQGEVCNGTERDGVYLIVEVHDKSRSEESNGEAESSKGKSENCYLMPFVNSDEISIRPIVKNVEQKKVQNNENDIAGSELSITQPNNKETLLKISGNVTDIAKMQLQNKTVDPKIPSVKKFTLKSSKFSPTNGEISKNNGENNMIATNTFYKKSPNLRLTATKPSSLQKKFQNSTKTRSPMSCTANLNRAIEMLKKSAENSKNECSSNIESKTNSEVLSSNAKVAVIANPVIPNIQEICTAHNSFDTSEIPEDMFTVWNANDIEENTLDSNRQLHTAENPNDAILMADIDLQEPYHMTGFPNPPGENRCWLNATLQALFAMPLLDTFHHYNLQDCSKLTKYLITTKLHWMKGASGRDDAYQTVKLLKEELGVLDETYPSERQQDVSEFLMILLNHIKTDLGKLISAEDQIQETENVPKNDQNSQKLVKMPQTPNKRQPLAEISTPKNNGMKRSHNLVDPSQSPASRKETLTHSVQDLLSPKLRKLSNPSDPSYKVHTPPLAPTNDEIISYRNPIDENFQLYLMEHYTCKGCQKNRQKKVDNLMLFVDIPLDNDSSPIDLQKAVENIFAPEERHLTCGTCKHDAHTMRTTFRRQPNILTLQVNRYGMSSEGIFSKISTDVKIPNNLDLNETFLYDASRGSTMYKPICIIAHAGGTMDCGHYTSYVRHGDQWYHYNDMNVAPMTEEEALSAAQMTAYLVFFVKSTSSEQDSGEVQV